MPVVFVFFEQKHPRFGLLVAERLFVFSGVLLILCKEIVAFLGDFKPYDIE